MNRTILMMLVLLLVPCGAAVVIAAPAKDSADQPAAEAGKKVLRAGAATSNITPWLGEAIVGNWNTPPAKRVHDELHARCLVLDDGAARIAIVLVDSVGIPREVFDEAKRQIHEYTGLPADHVLTAATHTHSATSSGWRNALAPDKDFSDYQKFVARRISDGVRRAINNLEPVRVGWGAADEPRQVTNRRRFAKPGMSMPNPFGGQDQVKGCYVQRDLVKPAGPVDPEIVFLSIQAADGRPIALLANYSMHYVGEVPSQDISADYFGAFADRIRQLLGADRLDPPFVGILSNGTSGDVDNTYSEPPGHLPPYARLRHVADDVAQAVFAQCRKLQYHDWVPVGMVQRELELAVRKPTAEQLLHAKEMLADPQRADKFPHERTYAQRIMRQQEAPATIRVIVQALRIGDLGIATSPFETFAETGLEIKAKSPLKPTCTIELANGGSYGYLPTPKQHQLGGYETWLGTNKVEIEASTRLIAALLEMLAELARAK
ncbi:MAG: neutral/alkaline non-lysosomal ceramidase N-terminal domain-containing protein [Kiritimatiellae bacterium]|nr:neutral/alkaline non-lysosomal ceramidase N-terminal domain-containing protein [Kiritimatiellia bacterium]MDD5523099.1 neutral/alkaline non-lysosomal ceramidase N-terminal domain-containing protein [Kiritimatiellia bacterium]